MITKKEFHKIISQFSPYNVKKVRSNFVDKTISLYYNPYNNIIFKKSIDGEVFVYFIENYLIHKSYDIELKDNFIHFYDEYNDDYSLFYYNIKDTIFYINFEKCKKVLWLKKYFINYYETKELITMIIKKILNNENIIVYATI